MKAQLYNVITSTEDCKEQGKEALRALGKSDTIVYTGHVSSIPGGCSLRTTASSNYKGQDDGHFETSGKVGKGRGDLAPVCKSKIASADGAGEAASLVPMTGTFTSNQGRKWHDQTPFIVSASTYVFGGYDGGWFKMASVDADGKFIENRHTKSCSVIADLTSTIWEAANRGGRYSVTNIKMSSVGGQWNSQEDDVLP